MAPNFDHLAAKAKAEFEKKAAEDARASAERHAARLKAHEAGIAQLQSDVLPMLNEAVTAIRGTGVEVRIVNRLKHGDYLDKPSIKFQLLGPLRASDGWRYESKPAFFESDGETITVGRGNFGAVNRPDTAVGTAPPEKLAQLVEKAIEGVLSDYYSDLREHSMTWGL